MSPSQEINAQVLNTQEIPHEERLSSNTNIPTLTQPSDAHSPAFTPASD